MIITEISQQKHKGRYNLFVDDQFFSGIDAEVIVSNGLVVGQDISEEKLNEIVITSEKHRAFEKIVDIISRGDYSESEVKDKLIKKGYNINGINAAIDLAKEYGYINDENYAQKFVQSKSLKSKREIQSKLYSKGIDKNIISEALQVISEEDEQLKANQLAEKYMRNKQPDTKVMGNLYNFLARKGYSHEVCMKTLKAFKDELED